MSIPLNTFTVDPVVSAFLPPLDEAYDALYMRATGGAALNDGTHGREVQFWTVMLLTANVIQVEATNSGLAGYSLPVDGEDVTSVCLAFDSNMAVAIAYMQGDNACMYFFNGQANAYQTLTVAGATSCRCVVDKTSAFFEGQSDVVFAYTTDDDRLCYRYQRERYATEHTVPGGSAGQTLVRLGPSLDNRLQFELLNLGP